MKRYHYATIDRETFLRASKVPLPGPDAYLAKDEQTEALNSILERGYRFVSLDPESNLAVFEKELPSNSSREIIKSMNRQQVIRDLIAGVEQAIEHAQGKGWRSPDILSMLQNLIRKAKEAEL
jgi:hypothetical protein